MKEGAIDNRARVAAGKPPKAADGHNAEETAISAVRSLLCRNPEFVDMSAFENVRRPKRKAGNRRPLYDYEFAELHYVTSAGGNDPELDVLVLDFTIATGARAQGVYGLTGGQILDSQQMIALKDKFARTDVMPVSAELIARLRAHATSRGGPVCDPASPLYIPDTPVFWSSKRNGSGPMTGRRLDSLAARWQASLDWAMQEQVALHHVRHTMGAVVSTRYGLHFKRRYLRHSGLDATENYGQCTTEQLALAMSELLKFEHPLVNGKEARETETWSRLGLR